MQLIGNRFTFQSEKKENQLNRSSFLPVSSQLTRDRVKCSSNWSNPRCVDRVKVVSVNCAQYVVCHSIDLTVVNKPTLPRAAVSNNLSANRRSSGIIRSRSLTTAFDDKQNLHFQKEKKKIVSSGKVDLLPGLFESRRRSDAMVAATIESIFNVLNDEPKS